MSRRVSVLRESSSRLKAIPLQDPGPVISSLSEPVRLPLRLGEGHTVS